VSPTNFEDEDEERDDAIIAIDTSSTPNAVSGQR
jgi:hypothetical protein